MSLSKAQTVSIPLILIVTSVFGLSFYLNENQQKMIDAHAEDINDLKVAVAKIDTSLSDIKSSQLDVKGKLVDIDESLVDIKLKLEKNKP